VDVEPDNARFAETGIVIDAVRKETQAIGCRGDAQADLAAKEKPDAFPDNISATRRPVAFAASPHDGKETAAEACLSERLPSATK